MDIPPASPSPAPRPVTPTLPPPEIQAVFSTPVVPPPTPEQQSWGAVISIVIIVMMIVVGAFYAWGKRIAEEQALMQPPLEQL